MKLSLRKTIAVISIAISVGVPVSTMAAPAGGIPTVDVSAWMGHLERLQAMQKQLESMSGYRLGDLNFNTEYFTDLASSLDIDAIMGEFGLKKASDYQLSGDVAALFDDINANAAKVAAVADQTLTQSQQRFAQLQGLINQLGASPDPKDVMDLQARISGEQTFLANELVKVQLLEQQSEANKVVYDQRIKQMAIESAGEIRSY